MSLVGDRLLASLDELPVPSAYWVAFSGGLDSSVLLHLMAGLRERLPAPLHAIHCDHGLQPASKDWAVHCAAMCEALAIPCSIIDLKLKAVPGESLEAVARQARYAAFAAAMGDEGMLLTAHHQDDQAETLLLQLLRGAGVAGLAAMPLLSRLGGGWQARPLLSYPRSELERYGHAHALSWIEDPSNQSLDFDRNYLRHQVMPLLKARWPATGATLSRSAAHCAEADRIVRTVAAQDLAVCRYASDYRLDIAALSALPVERRAPLLRAWIDCAGLPQPPAIKLSRMLDEVVTARPDAAPLVVWPGGEVRRFRDQLCLMPGLGEVPEDCCLSWSADDPLTLPAGLGELEILSGRRGIDPQRWDRADKEVRFRREGLSCTPAGRRGSRSLKKLFQDLNVPPWLRERVPLLFLDGDLAAVGDYCVCEPFAAAEGEGVLLNWRRPVWF